MKGNTIKHLKENMSVSSLLWSRQRFLKLDTKTTSHKRKKTDQLDFIKTKNFCLLTDNIKRMKNTPLPGRRHLQYINLTKDSYPEYISNSYTSIKKKSQLKKKGKKLE